MQVTSLDGTAISYTVTGKGPGLLVIHGSFRASEHYQRLAGALSDQFTVYVMDRRGRNESSEKGKDYCMQKECEDAISIMEKHGIKYLFGHSFGATAALHIALLAQPAKLALFEAPLVGIMDISWVPKFEKQLNQNEMVAAMITFIKGMKMGGPLRFIPNFILQGMFKSMAHGEEWQKNCRLLKTVPAEFACLTADENKTFQRFQTIETPTLLLYGSKTTGYLKAAVAELGKTLKNSETVMLAGLDHNGPDEGNPEQVAAALKVFFKPPNGEKLTPKNLR
jgi:pimeloyl-ACP methyl ester carboxylesterase